MFYIFATTFFKIVVAPWAVDYAEKMGHICRYPWLILPINVAVMALCLSLISPFTTAMLNRKGEIKFKYLEPELQVRLIQMFDYYIKKITLGGA